MFWFNGMGFHLEDNVRLDIQISPPPCVSLYSYLFIVILMITISTIHIYIHASTFKGVPIKP